MPATEVLGAFAAELREQVAAQRTWDERFAVIDSLLGRRAATAGSGCGDGVRPEVAHAWRRLRTSRGAVSVAELAAETGWSARHLNSLFHAEVGLSPKEAARVVRFDHARRRIARAATACAGAADASGIGLADLAAECGYYDQAHLAREFRSLSGCPPTQWLAEEFRFVQAMPAGLGE